MLMSIVLCTLFNNYGDQVTLPLECFSILKRRLTLSHMIYPAKTLFAYGIRGTALKLLKSYLTDRTQYVIYDGMQSTTLLLSAVCLRVLY